MSRSSFMRYLVRSRPPSTNDDLIRADQLSVIEYFSTGSKEESLMAVGAFPQLPISTVNHHRSCLRLLGGFLTWTYSSELLRNK